MVACSSWGADAPLNSRQARLTMHPMDSRQSLLNCLSVQDLLQSTMLDNIAGVWEHNKLLHGKFDQAFLVHR